MASSKSNSTTEDQFSGILTIVVLLACLGLFVAGMWIAKRQAIVLPIMFLYWVDYHAALLYVAHFRFMVPPSAVFDHGRYVMHDDYV